MLVMLTDNLDTSTYLALVRYFGFKASSNLEHTMHLELQW